MGSGAQWNRNSIHGRPRPQTLERIRVGLPFVLRALDVDNGSEFVNDAMLGGVAGSDGSGAARRVSRAISGILQPSAIVYARATRASVAP